MVTIHTALDGGSDPRQYARQVVEYLRNLLLIRMGNEKQIEATKDVKARMRAHSEKVELAQLLDWIGNFNDAISDLRTTWQPSLALEVSFARCLNAVKQEVVSARPVREDVFAQVDDKVEAIAAIQAKPARIEEKQEGITSDEDQGSGEGKSEPKAEQAEVSPGGGSITTQDILAEWSQIRSEVKLRRSQAEALLNSQRLVQIKNGVLLLGFPSEMLKSKMENPENIEITRRVIHNILHVDVPIECIVVTGRSGGVSTDTDDLDPDGLVKTAINLGGKLVHKD